MIIKFYRLNKLAGLLNLPYLAWVSFATILNLSVYALN
jgi:tryptophan-rich sensory protein